MMSVTTPPPMPTRVVLAVGFEADEGIYDGVDRFAGFVFFAGFNDHEVPAFEFGGVVEEDFFVYDQDGLFFVDEFVQCGEVGIEVEVGGLGGEFES